VSEPDLAALFFKSALQELLKNIQRLKTFFKISLPTNLFIQAMQRFELCSTEKNEMFKSRSMLFHEGSTHQCCRQEEAVS
jgi:hypothetical protein